jgi:CspA family cold shock protein
VFVHIRQVEQSGMSELQDNQKVSFDVETGNNGKSQATNIQAV